MWFNCVLWSPCLTEWLVWFDEIKSKRGHFGCDVSFHERLVNFVA